MKIIRFKKTVFLFCMLIVVGCAQNKGDLNYICSESNALSALSPEGFTFTPMQAIQRSRSYFLENPFALVVFADKNYYYVDIATISKKLKEIKNNGLKIDGKTGEVVRGEKRIIGK